MSQILNKLKTLQGVGKKKLENLANSKLKSEGQPEKKKIKPFGFELKRISITIVSIAIVSILGFQGYKYFRAPAKVIEARNEIPQTPFEIQRKENKKAINFYNSGQLDQAITTLQSLLVKFPNQADVYINLAMAYKKNNDHIRAKKSLLKAISLSPKNEIAHNNLGMLAAITSDFDLAENSFLTALRLKSDMIEPVLNLATLYEKNYKLELALDYYRKYVTHPSASGSLKSKIKRRLPRLHSMHSYQKNKGL